MSRIRPFWSTSCGFCKFIYPHLRDIAREYPASKVALIGISSDTDFDGLRQQVEEQEFTWPQICEGNNWQDTLFKLYNVRSIPVEYILDQDGKIAFKLNGGGEKSGAEFVAAVRSLVV